MDNSSFLIHNSSFELTVQPPQLLQSVHDQVERPDRAVWIDRNLRLAGEAVGILLPPDACPATAVRAHITLYIQISLLPRHVCNRVQPVCSRSESSFLASKSIVFCEKIHDFQGESHLFAGPRSVPAAGCATKSIILNTKSIIFDTKLINFHANRYLCAGDRCNFTQSATERTVAPTHVRVRWHVPG